MMAALQGRPPRSLGIIHTVTGLVPIFDDLVGRHMPEWKAFNIVDESLLRNTIRTGEVSPMTMRRLAGHVWSAVDAGAEAILVTCSSLGPAAETVGPLCPVPLVRVDIGMVDRALDIGSRIGVLATLPTTLKPTSDLVRTRASLRGLNVVVAPHLCDGAFDLLAAGDKSGHDARIVAAASALSKQVDVLILAQASMARAFNGDPVEQSTVPVLSSPELGVLNLLKQLG